MASQQEVKRLAFIRYLYATGVDESQQQEPMAAAAVLTFHDAVEAFLALAAMSKGVKIPDNFMLYWDVLQAHVPPNGLGLKERMRHLNAVRNKLKHEGVFPAKFEIDDIRGDVRAFFSEHTPLVFGVNFDEISLADFVDAVDVRTSLKEAIALAAQGDTKGAIESVALAFDQLIGIYRGVYQHGYPWYSPLYIEEHLAGLDRLFPPDQPHFDPAANVAQLIRGVLGALQDAIWFLSLGLDYRRFTKFESLTPRVAHIDQGVRFVPPNPLSETPPYVMLDDCRFCIDFVIDCAIRLQSIDAEAGAHKATP